MKFNLSSPIVLALLVLSALSFAACTKSPQLTEGGKQVQFVENVDVVQDKLDDPEKCKLVAHLEVKSKIAIGMMESSKISEHKQRLIRVRNITAKNGGNLMIADGDVVDNTQKFKAYNCK